MADFVVTQKHKFLFDLKGYLVIPGVLDGATCETIKADLLRLHLAPDAKNIDLLSGPAQELLDHPVVVALMTEFLHLERPAIDREKAYPFRCEGSFFNYREKGTGAGGAGQPHGGEPEPFKYHYRDGRIYGGLMRAVWELNEIKPGDRGTLFMPGTHKANFPVPRDEMVNESALFDHYTCPAGSLIIFTEDLIHSGPVWDTDAYPRVTIFTGYSALATQHGRCSVPQEVIDAMPAKRKTLFRGTWLLDLAMDKDVTHRLNDYYGPDNRAH